MAKFSIVREDDDVLAETRLSIGSPRGMDGYYLVFRGEPDKVLIALRAVLAEAESQLPQGGYDDKRKGKGS